MWTAGSCSFKISFLRHIQCSRTPCHSRLLPRHPVSQSPWRGQSLPSGSPRWQFCWPSSLHLWDLKLNHFVITVLMTASDHHITHKSFPVHKQQVQHGTFHTWLPYHLCQEVIIHTLHNHPGFFSLLQRSISSKHWLNWSLPQEQGMTIMRLLPAEYRIFLLAPRLGWMV